MRSFWEVTSTLVELVKSEGSAVLGSARVATQSASSLAEVLGHTMNECFISIRFFYN